MDPISLDMLKGESTGQASIGYNIKNERQDEKLHDLANVSHALNENRSESDHPDMEFGFHNGLKSESGGEGDGVHIPIIEEDDSTKMSLKEKAELLKRMRSISKVQHVIIAEEYVECLPSSWYTRFRKVIKNLSACATTKPNFSVSTFAKRLIPTQCIVMPEEVVKFFIEVATVSDTDSSLSDNSDDGDSISHVLQKNGTPKDADVDWDESESDEQENVFTTDPIFVEFNKKLESAIEKLGGNVVPRVMWKVPTDGKAFLLNKLKCSAPSDIYTLIKSSPSALHILADPFKGVPKKPEKIQIKLFLSEWKDFQPSDEFRLFICGFRLVVICQRDPSISFPRIVKEKDKITSEIYDFYNNFMRYDTRMKFCAVDIVRRNIDCDYSILGIHVLEDDVVCPYFAWKELESLWKSIRITAPIPAYNAEYDDANDFEDWHDNFEDHSNGIIHIYDLPNKLICQGTRTCIAVKYNKQLFGEHSLGKPYFLYPL